LIKNTPIGLLNIFLAIIFVSKGGPIHLISFRKKNHGNISSGILFRRSKKIEPSQHWNETRLGEISVNWSVLCKSSKDVLYDSSTKNLLSRKSKLIDPDKTRAYSCNLDIINDAEKECYPFIKTIEFNQDLLKIVVVHNKTVCNKAHSDINCYLTTNDGSLDNKLVECEDWDNQPLNTKKFKGLRGKYKVHLMYHFAGYEDYDLN